MLVLAYQLTIHSQLLISSTPQKFQTVMVVSPQQSKFSRQNRRVIGHGILAGKYLAEYRDLLK
jgi:hypothetical protein